MPKVNYSELCSLLQYQSSNQGKGILLVLLASVMLSLQNVVARVILREQYLFGHFQVGGWIAPTLGNSLLILMMRMLLMVPLLAFFVGPRLYPLLWRDLMQLTQVNRLGLLGRIIGSGIFLFLSQCFMYVALGNIPAGIAITVFFIYPTVTLLLTWLLFGERPDWSIGLGMIVLYCGCFLSIPTTGSLKTANVLLGVGTAVTAGVAFSINVVLTQACSQKFNFHPVPFSLANIATTLILSISSVVFFNYTPIIVKLFPIAKFTVAPGMWISLWISVLILALVTVVGYLLNNYGILLVGASLSSVIGSTGPIFTSALAWFFLGEILQMHQAIGMLLVSISVAVISFQRINIQAQ
jgi:drug/metabolite transporter (DMT)-like permease